MNPDEFLKCVPEDDIVDEIFEALALKASPKALK